MRIVHVSCVVPPKTGGIGTVAFEEVRQLRSRGYDAVVVAPTSEKETDQVKRLPMWMTFGNAGIPRAADVRRVVADADIVHLHYPFYGVAEQIASLRKKGIIKKLVVTLHMDATASGWKGMVFAMHRALFQQAILDAADALLISSKDYAEHSSFAPWMDRVIELPFGVDEHVFAPAQAMDGAQSSVNVLHVGGMDAAHAFKGVGILLEAVAMLPKNISATLVGDGDLRPGFERRAKDLGIADRVTFAGKLSQTDLIRAYHAADVFAFPSTSQAEAFGLAAVEAEACGVPVVASDLPGVRTVVANGETGFLVPPSDAKALAERLAYLANHWDVREAMGQRARQRVMERFTWSRHTDALANVYQRLCGLPS